MSKFTHFTHMINLSMISLFPQFFFMFIDLQKYASLSIHFGLFMWI